MKLQKGDVLNLKEFIKLSKGEKWEFITGKYKGCLHCVDGKVNYVLEPIGNKEVAKYFRVVAMLDAF